MPESFRERSAQYKEARPADTGNRNGSTGANSSESQMGWAAFTQQQTGQAEPQSAKLLRNGAQNGTVQAPDAAKEKPWQALADSQQARASSRTMSHKERMQVALFCNKIMVNAFRKFAAAVEEARHLPDESQLVLQVTHLSQHMCDHDGCFASQILKVCNLVLLPYESTFVGVRTFLALRCIRISFMTDLTPARLICVDLTGDASIEMTTLQGHFPHLSPVWVWPHCTTLSSLCWHSELSVALQDFVHEIQHVLSQNRQNLDDVNIATALYQLEHAYSIIPPQGQNYAAASQLLPQLVSQAGKMVEKFKIDSVIMTVSALAKLSDAGHGRLPFPATVNSDGGAQIQV